MGVLAPFTKKSERVCIEYIFIIKIFGKINPDNYWEWDISCKNI